MSKRECVTRLAPVAPPCYPDRLSWIEWLVSLAESEGEWSHGGGKLILTDNGVARFNLTISFCSDCSRSFRGQMLKEGRCNPGHLRDIEREQRTERETT